MSFPAAQETNTGALVAPAGPLILLLSAIPPTVTFSAQCCLFVSFIVFHLRLYREVIDGMFSESGRIGPKFSRSFSALKKRPQQFKTLSVPYFLHKQQTDHARSPRWRRPELMMLWGLRVELSRAWPCKLSGKDMTAFPSSIPFYDAYFQKFFRRFTMSLTEHALPSEFFFLLF